MIIKPFAVEEWMNAWEVGAKYNIAETCVDSVSVDELFAEVISEPAREVLLAHNIPFFAEKTVPAIRNRSGDGFCPMESAVLEIQAPVEALEAIRKTLNALRTPKTE